MRKRRILKETCLAAAVLGAMMTSLFDGELAIAQVLDAPDPDPVYAGRHRAAMPRFT